METAGRSAIAKNLFVTVLIISLLAAGGFFVFKNFIEKDEDESQIQAETLGVEAKKQVSGYEIEIDKASLVGNEEIELAYEYPAIMDEILVQEGSEAKAGDIILKLNVRELVLQKQQLEAVLIQAKASLQKVGAGATKEDIDISKTRKDETEDSLEAAKKGVIDALRAGYTASNDAVSAKTNQLFTDPEGNDPQLVFTPTPATLEATIESKRKDVNNKIDSLADQVNDLDLDSDFPEEADDIRDLIIDVQDYMNTVAQAVNSLTVGEVDQVTIDAWKTAVSAGRAEIETTKAIINESYNDYSSMQTYHSLSEKELEYKEALARQEDVMIAQAKVNEVQGQIAVLDERIRKSDLIAPFDGKVMKIWFKKSELVPAYQKVISFSSSQSRISADVLEDDIRNVRPGGKVTVKFRSMPEKTFSGTIGSTEPQRVIIDGDVYYRTYIALEESDPELRQGMTADVFITAK